MPTLYVTEPRSVVRRSARSIVVTLDEASTERETVRERRNRLIEVEPHRLDLVALFGQVHITSDATRHCLREGIDLAWFSRHGRLLGRAVSELSRSAEGRLGQYRRAENPVARLAFAKTIVDAKIRNEIALLKGLQSNRPGDDIIASAIRDVRRAIADIDETESPSTLLGMEGIASRRYFAGLKQGFCADIRFDGRARRPPPDPANALLSLGYVMLGQAVAGLIEAVGLDPAIGFYHELRPGRASLALDLVEELRAPVVDRFVLRVCNLRIVRPDMFTAGENGNGVRLTQDGLKKYLAEWAKHWERPLREEGVSAPLPIKQIVRRQVERLAVDLRDGDSYVPLRATR